MSEYPAPSPVPRVDRPPAFRLFLWPALSAAFLALAPLSLAASPAPTFPKPGEWPAFRRDGSLQAHSPARGSITAPRIVWRQFIGVLESEVVLEPGPGSGEFSLPLDEVAPAAPEPGDFLPKPASGHPEPSATTTYARVLPGTGDLQKLEFESGFSKPTVNGQWQKCVGRCFARRDGQWAQVWETQPIDLLFQPLPLAGDFHGDGKPEIAILPFHELLLLDGETGAVKDRCRFTDTRSYGFFGAYDLNHDGHTQFLVQADFSKHVDVLGFRQGKLSLLWQQNVEADISNPQKILRVGPNPVADVDGDGRSEVLTTLFNERGDHRWRVTVHDGLTGRVKAELPDEYLVALLDLEGRGVSQLLTVATPGAGVPEFGTIRVRSLQDHRLTTLWQKDEAAWQTWEPPLPANVQSTATFGRTTAISRRGPHGLTVVLAEKPPDRRLQAAATPATPTPNRPADLVTLSTARWDGHGFQELMRVTGRRLRAVGLDPAGRLLVRVHHPLGEPAALQLAGAKATLLSARRVGGSPGPVAVAWPDDREAPGIFVQGHGEELATLHFPRGDGRAAVIERSSGRGQSISWPDTLGPVIADLAGDGQRQLIFADAGPDGSARLSAASVIVPPRPGNPGSPAAMLWRHVFPEIPGSAPVWNTGGIILWQTGHFTDARRRDVLVTLRRSMMHSEETVLLSGRDGRELWRRNRQISQRGVGGTPFAVADYDGDGLDDAASLHPSILYLLKGSTGADLLAKDATWKEVPAQPVYWGQPIAGDFLGAGRPALFFGGRSMTGLVRADGSLVWWDALDHGPQDWPAFGNFTGRGRLEAVGAGYPDGVRCYDAATGQVLWRLPMPAQGRVIGSASADLAGTGRDQALFVIGQELVCLGADGPPAQGRVLWRLPLPAQTGPPTLAALDPTGTLSILLSGADGYVYAVR